MGNGNESILLQIKDLKMHFPIKAGIIFDHVIGHIKALDGVDLTMDSQDVIGLVGESGSGKSTLAKVLLLLEKPTSGQILFEGKDILGHKEKSELKEIRRKIQAVFQDPFASLSPRFRVGKIISEPLEITSNLTKNELQERVYKALNMVGMDQAIARVFPHELSGGQRQRVAIARAVSSEANIIILDEPTSSLDVSIRLQIIELLMELQQKVGLSYLLIGHDLGMVAYMSKKIAVMYLGKIVEFAETQELLKNTIHPYTRALISASLPDHPREKKDRILLAGEIANPINVPPGCRFHPRCTEKKPICSEQIPPLKDIGNNHLVACHL